MKINRLELLGVLESVSPGLNTEKKSDGILHSNCFTFKDGMVYTFNDAIFCRRPVKGVPDAVVSAGPLLNLLSKMKDSEVSLQVDTSESGGCQFSVSAPNKKSGILMYPESELPLDLFTIPNDWHSLEANFNEAVVLCCACAAKKGKDDNVFEQVYVSQDLIEATDRYQMIRYHIQTGIKSVALPSDVLRQVITFGVCDYAQADDNWIHFRNPSGLLVSCRTYDAQDKPDLGRFFMNLDDSIQIPLPVGVEEMVDKAVVFSSENVSSEREYVDVHIADNKITVEGRGVFGWYKERMPIEFSSAGVSFRISPVMLREIIKKDRSCLFSKRMLQLKHETMEYAACLMRMDADDV